MLVWMLVFSVDGSFFNDVIFDGNVMEEILRTFLGWEKVCWFSRLCFVFYFDVF